MSSKIKYIDKPKILKDKAGKTIDRVDNILNKDILKHQKSTKNDKLLAPGIFVSCERRILITHINEALEKKISKDEIIKFIENILNYEANKCENTKEDILFIGIFDDINDIEIKNFILNHGELNGRIKFIKETVFDDYYKKRKESVVEPLQIQTT